MKIQVGCERGSCYFSVKANGLTPYMIILLNFVGKSNE